MSPKEEIQIIQDAIKSIKDQAKKSGSPPVQSVVDRLVKLEARFKELTEIMNTSTTKPEYLPVELVELLDEAIECVYADQELPSNIDELYEWFEDDGIDHMVTTEATLSCVLSLDDILQSFEDDEVADDNEVSSNEVTDKMRIAYARREIKEALDSLYYMRSVYCAEVKGSKNKVAFLGCTVEEQGQSGLGFSWWGLYKSQDDFINDIKNSNWLVFDTDIESVTDQKILELLNQV